MAFDFTPVPPERAGLPGAAAIWGDFEQGGLPVHSLLIARHGALVCERYAAPFTKRTPHRLYSITKSFVSLAVGLLCEEGRLHLEDHIVGYFPDKLPPSGPDPRLAALTVRDMLRMATPYRRTTYKDYPADDWVGTFFTAPADHDPGAFFSYDTSATHTLCALVERLTGGTLLGFLRTAFLDEIGVDPAATSCLADPVGVSQGGSGLLMTPRDLMRVLALVADGGLYEGRRLLPPAYLLAATACQIDTAAYPGDGIDFAQGYGYQFWRTRHGWCMYGMGGQLALCLPKEDLLIVTTADPACHPGGVQRILDILWARLLPVPAGKGGARHDAV